MTGSNIPDAFKRVVITEDFQAKEPAKMNLDAAGGADIAQLTVNPQLLNKEERLGYSIQAAVHSVLEPFRRYHRTMTRRYGSYDHEEKLFDQAEDRALYEIQQLIHAGPEGLAANLEQRTQHRPAPEQPAEQPPVAPVSTSAPPGPVTSAPASTLEQTQTVPVADPAADSPPAPPTGGDSLAPEAPVVPPDPASTGGTGL